MGRRGISLREATKRYVLIKSLPNTEIMWVRQRKVETKERKVRTYLHIWGGGRKYSLKYRINQSWRKLVTGGRKARPSGREKATHAKLVRKLNHSRIYCYFLFCSDQFEVMLNFVVKRSLLQSPWPSPRRSAEARMPSRRSFLVIAWFSS